MNWIIMVPVVIKVVVVTIVTVAVVVLVADFQNYLGVTCYSRWGKKKPRTRLDDEFCEEPAHPHLFPTGEFGYKVEREIQISPSKYLNQRLLNYCQKSASDSDYIFCSFSSTEIAA